MPINVKNSCPSCGSPAMSPFYEVESVPVHSCLLMPTEREARQLPRGNIVLGFCQRCGFISNLTFDAGLQNYLPAYEDQQCFSPIFNAFANNLVSRLIEKYDLREKDIIEIGCGKGDFLLALCELGHNRGVGIDPTIRVERLQSPVADRVVFIQDYYSERYANYHGDFVCCRHTLEHIHPTAEFVGTVRRAIGKRLNTVVFFEVPDVTRILQKLAFWDIYYEHCSYFSPGSLARLFRFCDFEVIDLSRDFDDQYLLMEAKPANMKSDQPHALGKKVAQIEKAVRYFAAHCRDKMLQWQSRLQQMSAEGKRLAIWGSGSKCVAFMAGLKLEHEIDCVVDINPYRHGKFIPGGKKIMSPEHLQTVNPDFVIIMNPIYREEIRAMLKRLDVMAEIMSVE